MRTGSNYETIRCGSEPGRTLSSQIDFGKNGGGIETPVQDSRRPDLLARKGGSGSNKRSVLVGDS